MGVATSREVTLTSSPAARREGDAIGAAEAARLQLAAEAYREACVGRGGSSAANAYTLLTLLSPRSLACQ